MSAALGHSVIVVSPRSEWTATVQAALEGEGLEVRVAATGELAIDAFVQNPAAALVIEIELPGRDGAATVESIRWAPGGEEALVVLVGLSADAERVRQVAVELSARPIPTGDVDAIRRALGSLEAPADHPPLMGEVTKQVSTEALLEQTRAPTREAELPVVTDVATRDTSEVAPLDDGPATVSAETDLPYAPTEERPVDDAEGHEVEARAKVLEEVARIDGDLEATPFAITLTRLGELRATGALLLSSAGDPRPTTTGESPKKVVFFRNGIPLHVRSNLVDECLGQVLLRERWIDRATLDASLSKVRAGAGKQGAVLIAMGALEPRALREALEMEQREKLFDLFVWPAGRFRFSEIMSPPGETVTLEMSMAEMVTLGVDRIPGPRVLDALASHLDRYPRPQEGRVPGLRRALPPEGKALVDAIDGETSTRALMQRAPSPVIAARWLHAGACLGAITFHDQPEPVVRERAESGLFDIRSEVRRLAMLLRDGQYAMALRVAPGDASAAGKAAVQLERAIRGELEGELEPQELRAAAFEVLSRLPRAALMVGGDFERSSIPPPPQASPGPLPPAPAPPRDITTQLPPEDPWGDDVTETALEDDVAPYPEVADEPGALPPLAQPLPPEPPPADPQLDERVEAMLRAERLFRRGCRALGRQAYEGAFEAFEQAVRLAPEEGEFLMHLGWARFHTGDRETGVAELRRAAERVPKMEQVHLWLARALRDVGDAAGARDAYGDALAANPDSRDALEELQALGSD